jgi:hypothetical protein
MSILSSVTVTAGAGLDPFTLNKYVGVKAKLKAFRTLVKTLGAGGLASRGTTRPTVRYGTATASATVTAATVVNANTVTINGVVLTATQHNSRATITIVIANTDVDDTVTINGVVFTAKNAESLTARQFDISGTATAAATSLVACINRAIALGNALLKDIITAKSVAGVVTIRAVTAGTGGDAITLVSDDSDGLAVTGSGFLAGGATVANAQFDFGGTDTETATALAAAVNACTTAGIPGIATATSSAAVVTVAAAVKGKIGNAVTLASSGATLAVSAARLAGGTDTLATL